MQWLMILAAAVTGVFNTVQAGSNTTLNKATATPVWSAAIVFAVAFGATVTAGLVSGQKLPAPAGLAAVPWWAWIGGVFGAAYIVCMMVVAGKVGAAVFTGITVTAAVTTSLVMDHFGLLGFAVHPAGWGRIAGGVMMVLGLGLIAMF